MEEIRHFPAPVVDRATVERIFRVRRRRANQLLADMGGYQIGRTGLVERDTFLNALEAIARGEEFHYEEKRRTRVHEKLAEARRTLRATRVEIAVPAAPAAPTAAVTLALPAGVAFLPGELRIAFDTPEMLLTRLYELSQAIAQDYDEFCKSLLVLPSPGVPADRHQIQK